MELSGKKIAILATNGFEQSELEVPRDTFKAAGATVEIISLQPGEIKGWDEKDWGRPVKVDKTLDQAKAGDYDALVLPGGQINPDLLRVEPKALAFIKSVFDAKKGRCRGLPCALAAGRDRHREGPQDDVLQIDQDRHRQCRGEVGGFRGRRRPGHHHLAQSR